MENQAFLAALARVRVSYEAINKEYIASTRAMANAMKAEGVCMFFIGALIGGFVMSVLGVIAMIACAGVSIIIAYKQRRKWRASIDKLQRVAKLHGQH